MLLAEALAERADIQTRIDQLSGQARQSARIQEGDTPEVDPMALVAEVERLMGRLQELLARINLTNTRTAYDATRSVTDAIAARDVARKRHKLYTGLAEAAAARSDRYSRNEIRYVPVVDIAATRKLADAAAKEYRELDLRLQQLNWSTELI